MTNRTRVLARRVLLRLWIFCERRVRASYDRLVDAERGR